jgi:mono/diheme cytochrome c family protein
MHASTHETEAPTHAKLAIVSVLSAALALSIGCRSGESTLRAHLTSNPSRPSKTVKVRPLNDRKFERTSERLARGKYLVNGIGECFACHGPYDLNAPGWPPVRGKEGSGLAFRSGLVAANLTSDRETGIGNWTDDMLARAIREGVRHDGHLLDPTVMPYEFYRSMSDEDLASVIVYLRSLRPIRNALPPMRTRKNLVAPYAIPIYTPVPQPDVSTQVKQGAYFVKLGACQWCHTLRDENRVTLPGLEFAGGDLITNSDPPYDQVTSANLTPDPSGISYYDEAQFLKTMHTGRVGARKISPIMPWWFFGQMHDDDLKAIFAYLRTLSPVHHRVDNTEPIAYCRVCKRKHHGGALN